MALRFGNLRLDHSCLIVTVEPDRRQAPVSFTVAAMGSFESERWTTATLPPELARNPLLGGGSLDVASDFLEARTGPDASAGGPRPELARELLCDTGPAIRVVVPADSKLWGALAFLQLPAAKGAELQVTFGKVTPAGGDDHGERPGRHAGLAGASRRSLTRCCGGWRSRCAAYCPKPTTTPWPFASTWLVGQEPAAPKTRPLAN